MESISSSENETEHLEKAEQSFLKRLTNKLSFRLGTVLAFFAVGFASLAMWKCNLSPWEINWLSAPEAPRSLTKVIVELRIELMMLAAASLAAVVMIIRAEVMKRGNDSFSPDNDIFTPNNDLEAEQETPGHAVFAGGVDANNANDSLELPEKEGASIDVTSGQVQSVRARVNADAQLRIATDEVDRLRRDLVDVKKKLELATVAKSEFMANMSHELLTPMNGIVGMTDLLLNGDLPCKEKRFVQSIAGSSNALMGIINDLLDISKIEAGSLKLTNVRFSLHDCVEDVCSVLAESAHAKNIELMSYIDENVPLKVDGDPSRVKQILNNLVSNAIAHTSEGEVVVRLTKVEEGGKSFYHCDVQDTGAGISPEMQAQLFSAFSQDESSVARQGGGIGMGLAITKELVCMMGGEVTFKSRLGGGTRFSITLALDEVSDEDAMMPRRRTMNGAHVLVVDDNDTNRTILFHQLSSWGLIVESAENGQQALECLREAHNNDHGFDAVVLDYNMPDIDGLELARRIQAEPDFQRIKALLLTSSELKLNAGELQEIGIYKHASKPVRQSVLHDSLASVMPNQVNAQKAPITKKPKSKTAKVLLVEDNSVNQDVAISMLEQLGCEVFQAENGTSAVRLAESEKFDLIFMDCQMPEMDGYEAAGIIKSAEAKNASTPIVALTANATVADKEKCLTAGMDDYVKKPVRTQTLSHMLDKWVAHPVNKLDPTILDEDPPMLFTGIRDCDIRSSDMPGHIEVNSDRMTVSTFDIGDAHVNVNSSRKTTMSSGDQNDAQRYSEASQTVKADSIKDEADDVLADSTADDSSSINVSAIDTIRSMQRAGREDLLTKVVAVFSNKTPEVIDGMLAAADESDVETVSAGAHSLCSSSAYLGANKMSALCKEIEAAIASGNQSELKALVLQLKDEYGAVAEELSDIVKAA